MILEVRDLEMSWGEKQILRGLSCRFEARKLYVLSGASGSGKSTLMKLISGHLKPLRGSVLWKGQPLGPPTRDIFYIQQEDDLFEWLTVSGHLDLCIELGASASEAEELLRQFELEHAGALYPFQLSLGMKKRLAVARALLMNPQVLILDETLSSLDADLRRVIFLHLSRWAQAKNRICIFVSHFPEEFSAFEVETVKI